MDDERIVKLLEEIRDLQRQHVENYKEAVKNQRESIEFNQRWQKKTREGQFWTLMVFVAVLTTLWLVTFLNR